MILEILFVMFMVFWAVFGAWWGSSGVGPDRYGRFGGTFFPWACVAILGWIVFNGGVVATTTVIR